MTQDQWNSLLVERASEMAHHRTIIDFIINTPFDKSFKEEDLWVSDGGDDDDSLVYTEEAQDVFNFYYDEYYDQLINTYDMPIV
jgi:hypothetical protein